MAIYVNEKVLEPKQNGNSLERRYFNERKELKDMFSKFRKPGVDQASIILTRDYTRQYNRNRTSFKPAPPISLPLVAYIQDEELGYVEIRFSKTPPRRIKPGVLQWDPNKDYSIFHDTWVIPENELDYAWFMLKGTNYLEKGLFRIIDRKADFDSQFDVAMLQKDVMNVLFNDDTTEEWLAKIAAEFFDPTEIDYESISGKEELAVKIYQKASNNHRAKTKPSFNELLAIFSEFGYKSSSNKKEVEETGQILEGEDVDGNAISIPLLKCPSDVDFFEMKAQATEIGIKTARQTKDYIYTMLQHENAKKLSTA